MNPHAFQYTPPPPMVIDFPRPIRSGAREFSNMTLGEPTAAQVRAAEIHLTDANGPRASRLYLRALVAAVSKMPEDGVSALPMTVFQRAADYLQGFVLDGLGTEGLVRDREFTIEFTPALDTGDGQTTKAFHVAEPTLDHMIKADGALRDMSAFNVRNFQALLVSLASGEKGSMSIVDRLPISVLNRAATFCMGFTTAGQTTSTT